MSELPVSSPSGIVLRQARREDAALVLDFICALADYEKLRHEVVATVQDIENTVFGDSSHVEVIIAERAGLPAGFVLYFANYSTFLGKPGIHIEDLFVLPELRGGGIGKSLLACVAHIARQRNWGRVEWSVLDWNTPALEFYASIGAAAKIEWQLQRLSDTALAALAADFAANHAPA
jgi:GNAT superfamily N-acetyltransferase